MIYRGFPLGRIIVGRLPVQLCAYNCVAEGADIRLGHQSLLSGDDATLIA